MGEIIFETASQVLIKLAIKQARSSMPCGCRDDKTKDQFLWWCKWLQLRCLQQVCTFPCELWSQPSPASDCDINSTELHSAGKKPWRREAKTDILQGFLTQQWATTQHLLCWLPLSSCWWTLVLGAAGQKGSQADMCATLCPPEAGKGLQACL